MQEPDCVDIEVFVGVDIAKGDHYACVVTSQPAPRCWRAACATTRRRSGA